MSDPQKFESWKKLQRLASAIPELKPTCSPLYSVSNENICINYSGQLVNGPILDALIELAYESGLKERINELFSGGLINHTEKRPALHTALRAFAHQKIHVNECDVVQEVVQARNKMNLISTKIREGAWLGYSGKPITDVVNIGIGGSMYSPMLCINALSDYVTDKLKFYFVAEINPHAFAKISSKLNPETTLFIVSSKSFTTIETLENLNKAIAWINQPQHFNNHFIAITANLEKATELGFNHIVPLWDWVGGRYSCCSSISLITCIAVGFENFSLILDGANQMDNHFYSAEFSKNLPVLLGLLGIWNINFLHYSSLLILTYSDYLSLLVPYLQQLDMESNGKSIDREGLRVDYHTGPIVWGGSGNLSQHSYFQLLCQSRHKIAVDLISIQGSKHEKINKICLGHRDILIRGVTAEQNPYDHIPGRVPVNHISLDDCTPQTLGALISLFEHKIFVQGIIWNINSFDQPGIECAKKIFNLKLDL